MDNLTLLYILAGIVFFSVFIWRFRCVSEKYEEAMDLMTEMENYYQKISILKKARDAIKAEIFEFMVQLSKKYYPGLPDQEEHFNINLFEKISHRFILETDENKYFSDTKQSEIQKIIQSKKEEMESCENELDHTACYYNLFAMRLKNIKNRFPLVAFMINDEAQNLEKAEQVMAAQFTFSSR